MQEGGLCELRAAQGGERGPEEPGLGLVELCFWGHCLGPGEVLKDVKGQEGPKGGNGGRFQKQEVPWSAWNAAGTRQLS